MMTQGQTQKGQSSVFKFKLFDLTQFYEVSLDLSSGKDRRRLEYILAYEGHKLRRRDRQRCETVLMAAKGLGVNLESVVET